MSFTEWMESKPFVYNFIMAFVILFLCFFAGVGFGAFVEWF